MKLEHDCNRLLDTAFPWGAIVFMNGAAPFFSIRYEAISSSDGQVEVYFERDPGDLSRLTTRKALLDAVERHVLRCEDILVRRPEPADMGPMLSWPKRDFLGPQSDSDNAWRARMRLHQSWWRAFRLRRPFGHGPERGSTLRYGNMLELPDAIAGANFISHEAKGAYDKRLAVSKTGIDRWRTSTNLLSSQAMAFNIFGHLAEHLDFAAEMLDALLGPDEVSTVTRIEIERLSNALDDRTAFDAFVTYTRPDGTPACLAIETKLTEPFSQRNYDWDHYLGTAAFRRGGWSTADTAVLGDLRWSQLWRNHLLAVAETLNDPSLGEPTLIVVHHDQDRDCRASIDGYRALLNDPTACRSVTINTIAETAVALATRHSEQEPWALAVADRYANLRLSEECIGLD